MIWAHKIIVHVGPGPQLFDSAVVRPTLFTAIELPRKERWSKSKIPECDAAVIKR